MTDDEAPLQLCENRESRHGPAGLLDTERKVIWLPPLNPALHVTSSITSRVATEVTKSALSAKLNHDPIACIVTLAKAPPLKGSTLTQVEEQARLNHPFKSFQ